MLNIWHRHTADWAQTPLEWGLSGAALFIATPPQMMVNLIVKPAAVNDLVVHDWLYLLHIYSAPADSLELQDGCGLAASTGVLMHRAGITLGS